MTRSRTILCGFQLILLVAAGGTTLAADSKDKKKDSKGYDARMYDDFYQGCNDWRDGRKCTNLGYLYAEGRTVEKDEAKAAEFYEKGCKFDDARGCTAIGVALVSGTGVAKNEAKAAEFFLKGCDDRDDADLRSCTNLGFLHIMGQGVAKDEAKAILYLGKACDGGNATGCNNIRNLQMAACQAGDGHRCLEGGRWAKALLAKQERPEGLQLDPSWVAGFFGEAARLLPLACEGRRAQGCVDSASMYAAGEGVPLDAAKAAEFNKKACDLGLSTACAR